MSRLTTLLLLFITHSLLAQKAAPPYKDIAKSAIATYTLAGYPDFLVADGNDAWVSNNDTLQKLSVKFKKPVAHATVTGACGAAVIGFGSLWVTSCKEQAVYRIDHITGKIIARIPVGVADLNGEIMLAAGGDAVWILSDSVGILSRIDPSTNAIVASILVKANSYCAVYGFGSVWISNTGKANSDEPGSVQRINPGTSRIDTTIIVGNTPRFLAAGEKGIWTLNQGDGTVSHIDPATNKVVATVLTKVPGTGGDIDAGAHRVWVRATKGTFMLTIDPINHTILTRYGPILGSGGVRVAGKYVWVSAHDVNKVFVLKSK